MANGLQAGFQQGTLTPVSGTEVALTGLQAQFALGRETRITLSGISLQGQQGSFTKTNTKALTGIEVSGVKGTFAFAGQADSIALSSQLGEMQLGTLTPTVTFSILGKELNGISGALQAESGEAVGLVGIQSTPESGEFTKDISKEFSGIEDNILTGSLTKNVSITLTGIELHSSVSTFIVGNKTLTTTWTVSPDTGVTGYYVYWDTQPRGNTNYQLYTYQADVSGRLTNSYTITGLLPATTYYINISSHGSGGHDNFESGLLGEVSAITGAGSYDIPISGVQSQLQNGTFNSQEISISLTGLQVNGIKGNLGVSAPLDTILSGVESLIEGGNFITEVDDELLGLEFTGYNGTFIVDYPYTLQGIRFNSSTGSLSKDIELVLSGVQSNIVNGQLSTNSDTIMQLTGVESSFERGDFTTENAPVLIGRQSSFGKGLFNAYIDGTKVYPNTTITDEDLVLIVNALLQDPRFLTLAKFLCLK